MADRPHGVRQLQVRSEPIHPHDKQHLAQAQGPSVTKILTVMSLFPIGGTLLTLAGLTFAGTMTGLAVTFPLFILFSPVLVPAVLVIGLAVAATLTSGAFGVTALSCLSWALNSFWKATGSMPEQIEQAERRLQDMKGYVGQKTKELGDTVESKAQEARRSPSRRINSVS